MRKVLFITSIFLLVTASCGRKGRKDIEETPAVRNFPTVSAPGMLTQQDEILEYVALHFWDAFADDGKAWADDSTHIAGVERTKLEEQVGAYSTILSMIAPGKAASCIEAFYTQVVKLEMRDSSSSAFEETVRLMSRYLYDENSPVRDEDIYGVLAARLAESPYVDEGLKSSYGFDAKVCALNKVGTKAADITMKDRNGREHSLYGIKAPWTLLFFTNPGCHACADIIESLNDSQKVRNMVDGGTLAIVNIYIDEDLESWRAHLDDYPSSWLTAYDKDSAVREKMTYNVRAIPSLYMLDKDKTVLLKDAPAAKVLGFIENIEE